MGGAELLPLLYEGEARMVRESLPYLFGPMAHHHHHPLGPALERGFDAVAHQRPAQEGVQHLGQL